MAEPKSMKILCICKVVPTDSPSQFSLPLTFFDNFFLRFKPTSRLFFYELSEPNTDFFDTILPNLKHSLSLALARYLPLAGNVMWPHDSDLPVIQYNAGNGVSLTVAETQADFDYLSGDVFRELAELHSLLPNFPSSETLIPAMTLQITLFQNRGFSIAFVVHHAVMDGKSTSLFLHSWAYIHKNGDFSVLPPELTPSYDRTFVQHHRELREVYPKSPIDPESRSLQIFDKLSLPTMLGTFKLTRENIAALKIKVKNEHTRVSTLMVAHAYITICLTRAKKVPADITSMRIGVDSRLRLDPPLPPTYFGNCLVATVGRRDTKDFLAEDGFVTAVSVVSDALENLNQGLLKVVERLNRLHEISVTKNYQNVAIGGSPRFELYNVDFGWGKPIKMDIVSIGIEEFGNQAFFTFSLSDEREGNGGIEIGIALEKHETKAFSTIFTNGLETP